MLYHYSKANKKLRNEILLIVLELLIVKMIEKILITESMSDNNFVMQAMQVP